MTHLKAGDIAPEIKIEGSDVSLEQFKGKKVILYFYPKDNTPGCTAESCNLRDSYEDLKGKNFEVIGVSPDSEKSHEKFATKHELPFHLVADTEKKIMEAYGVWGEKKMNGKTYMGVLRTTFIIDEEGKIEEVIPKVKTKDHTNQIYSVMSI